MRCALVIGRPRSLVCHPDGVNEELAGVHGLGNTAAKTGHCEEREASDAYVKKLLSLEEKHFKKYGRKKMSLKELDELCGVRK